MNNACDPSRRARSCKRSLRALVAITAPTVQVAITAPCSGRHHGALVKSPSWHPVQVAITAPWSLVRLQIAITAETKSDKKCTEFHPFRNAIEQRARGVASALSALWSPSRHPPCRSPSRRPVEATITALRSGRQHGAHCSGRHRGALSRPPSRRSV